MFEACGRPIFPRVGFIPVGHCGLHKGHDGFPEKCAILVETVPEHERDASKQLELDLADYWKPIRDIADEDTPLFPIGDED